MERLISGKSIINRAEKPLKIFLISSLLPISGCNWVESCGQWQELKGDKVVVLECPNQFRDRVQSTKVVQGQKIVSHPDGACEFKMDLPKVNIRDLGNTPKASLVELAYDPDRCIALYGEVTAEAASVQSNDQVKPTAIPADLANKPKQRS